ncbi:MAG: hypothetical protein GY834_01890 [Bacteroidetes bacterium]|nr:hypothetical protein [Bacteroidota bacterium]
MKKTNYLFILISIIALTFTACQKEGAPGLDGVVDVYSYYYTISEYDWDTFGDPGIGFGYIGSMDFPEITEDVLNYGAVLVYLYQTGSLYSLPITFVEPTTEGGYLTSIWLTLNLGEVLVTFQDSDGLTGNPGNMEFKVVIIDGYLNIPSSLNLKSYDEVKNYFNLK